MKQKLLELYLQEQQQQHLAGATKVIVKTPHEAIGIPTKEANASGIKATKMTLNMLQGQRMPMSKELETEIAIIKAETKCMMDKVFELGNGDLAIGTVKGFATGVSRYTICTK